MSLHTKMADTESEHCNLTVRFMAFSQVGGEGKVGDPSFLSPGQGLPPAQAATDTNEDAGIPIIGFLFSPILS